MSVAVVLDTSPLGLLVNLSGTAQPLACRAWLRSLQAAGRRIIVPEIADYERRRELVRANRKRSLAVLDSLCTTHEYLPITTTAMRVAADLWAQVRNAGLPTAGPAALDGDAILAAQATVRNVPFVIATEHPAHISRFAPAELWSNIIP
jgi:predicted nucleic acid-binding protein